MQQMLDTKTGRALVTLSLGGAGAGVAHALGLPAPFLTGPAAVVSLASMLGLNTAVPIAMRDGCFIVIGLSMGTGINPEILAAAVAWPASLVALAVGLVAIFLGGAATLRRWLGFDRVTALLCATPGHLSYILSLSTDLRADIPMVAVVQSLRVLILTLLVPLAVALLSDADLSMSGGPGATLSLLHLAALLIPAIALGWLFKRWRLPAASLLAAMLVSSLGHGTGVTPGAVPLWLALPSFAIMGTLIGTRFAGITAGQIARALGAAGLLTGLALLVTVAAALAMHWMLDVPMVTLLIAYAPGGLETMAAISVMLEADPAFVAFHHACRIILLTFLVPAFLPRTEPET